jgi:hypothetical protein
VEEGQEVFEEVAQMLERYFALQYILQIACVVAAFGAVIEIAVGWVADKVRRKHDKSH